ncbi:MAG TPA: chloride channel protein, partial [Acidimicrobiia bacterium]|nr:chloride channel protein [Acidimicrobiia bacterium]
DVELLVDNIHVSGGAPDVRSLQSLVPMSAMTIAAGAAAGPEAPLVTTCGTLASWVAGRRRSSATETRCLTIAGMAAAFAVLFGAPIGSAFFALEILHRRGMQYHEALVPALIGALSGYACSVVLTGAGMKAVWTISSVEAVHLVDFVWATGAGLGGAIVAILFTYFVVGLRRVFRLMPRVIRPVVGGFTLALFALWSPYALTFGEQQTGHVLQTRLAVGVLVVAVVAKLIGTSATVASGWPGGFIIPLFFMGATLGQLTHHAFGNVPIGIVVASFMAAANVGVTKTLLGSTLVVSEMGGLRLLPTTLLAALISQMLTSSVGLIESQRERTPMDPSDNHDVRGT